MSSDKSDGLTVTALTSTSESAQRPKLWINTVHSYRIIQQMLFFLFCYDVPNVDAIQLSICRNAFLGKSNKDTKYARKKKTEIKKINAKIQLYTMIK